MYGGCLLCPVYPLLIETFSCLLLLRVASGKRLKNLKKSGQLLHVFFIIIIKSLGYFDDSECKVDYTFPDSHFYIKGFRLYCKDRDCFGGCEFIYVRRGLIVTRIHDLEEHKVESITPCVCKCPGLSCSNVG